jgi:hypothetical protein
MESNDFIMICLYFFMGLGVLATSQYRGNGKETPLLCFLVILFWPILLALYALVFVFTGKKVND